MSVEEYLSGPCAFWCKVGLWSVHMSLVVNDEIVASRDMDRPTFDEMTGDLLGRGFEKLVENVAEPELIIFRKH